MMKTFATILFALAIPLTLFVGVWQTSQYGSLENEVKSMEKEQYEVIALNRRLISGITLLSTPERIEKVATEDLGMRKALPDEITRIELKKGKLGG